MEELYSPPHYSVIGQQKCGTSTLWNQLIQNPVIRWAGPSKELFFWNVDLPKTTLCDNHIESYLLQVAIQREKFNRTDVLMGDWSTTYFSCLCCPLTLKMLNPKMKIIVVLRDPVQRALSRFLEQKRNERFPLHKEVKNHTFATFVDQEVDEMDACVERASAFKNQLSNSAVPVGWGGGMSLGQWMEAQCFARRNIIGWSAYDVFLENYLAHFPPGQVLVLYTNELAENPLSAIRKTESFLGAPEFNYDPNRLSMVFNSRACYHWKCAKKANEIKAVDDSEPVTNRTAPFLQAVSRLTTFFKPRMQRMFKWADEGRIADVPPAWRSTYA
eukprot:XP_001694262.1 predicted protein [Chlamydomonas reinhardtii]